MTTELLTMCGMERAKPLSVPLNKSSKLVKVESEPLDQANFPYSQLTGSLLWVTVSTRPDIAQAVVVPSKYSGHPL